MDLLAAFRTYVRVAESGSFSAVAREMGATQPAISRQVAALEEHLGARLIQRTTRSLTLTEDGRDLLGHALRVLDTVDEAEAAVGRRHSAPSGLIRLAAPASFGRLYVAPRMPRLLVRYPELLVELRMSDGVADLVADGIDLAIRGGAVTDASLVARRIGSSARQVLGSAEYFREYGEPTHPSDLSSHSCVVFLNSPTPFEWSFEGAAGGTEGEIAVPITGRFRTDSSEAVREAVVGGLGLALVPAWQFAEDLETGRVRPVLQGFQAQPVAIHAVYPSRRNLAPRTRAVIDFLLDEFRLDPAISSYGEG